MKLDRVRSEAAGAAMGAGAADAVTAADAATDINKAFLPSPTSWNLLRPGEVNSRAFLRTLILTAAGVLVTLSGPRIFSRDQGGSDHDLPDGRQAPRMAGDCSFRRPQRTTDLFAPLFHSSAGWIRLRLFRTSG